ncbi:MAG: sulfide/dihydroorotate dehydrogenase-like FAD/NAD-binding protein, partial [Polyangiaceae bacterium]|nr:sulfide/dihydroorotate dehydrogenase-like FAD/NAD-binding protein [Polyangiaceae bacterium]
MNGYRIVKRDQFGPVTFLWDVEAPRVARAAQPGHFLMTRIDATGERIPLTVADFDAERGTVTVVIQAVGKTTRQMMALPEGSSILDFVGPLGVPSHVQKVGKVVLVGGGLGVAPIFPQLRALKLAGNTTFSILGFRNKDLVFWEDKFRRYSDEVFLATDDGSAGRKGLVTDVLRDLCREHKDIAQVVAIGSLPMMRACANITRELGIRTLVSLNSIMVDGTGMCGSCRVTIGGEMRFACVDGPDFDGHQVDFDELILRQKRFEREEKESLERYERENALVAAMGRPAEARAERHVHLPFAPGEVPIPLPAESRPVVKNIRTIQKTRTAMPEQPAGVRAHNFLEVNLGYGQDDAKGEANRCLYCKKPRCVPGCPVGIDIPAFIRAVSRQDLRTAYGVLKASNALPAVCGRVCPQESQCEATCIVGKKLEPVAIGRLERFVADFAMSQGWDDADRAAPTGHKVAIVGSGPAGLACAGDLVKHGVDVTIYEALHVAGGVLKYGIPEFRLPDHIIDIEVESLRKQGVKIELDAVIGKLLTVPQLLGEMGNQAVFIATGAGSPKFMNIP